MKCFHFTNGEKEGRDDGGVVSRTTSKVSSWARSLSMASSALDARRSEFDSDSRDSLEFLTQRRRANDRRVFTFDELKTATRGFSRGLIVGEGRFGCVYSGVVTVSECEDDERGIQRLLVHELMHNKSLEDRLSIGLGSISTAMDS
ncbi:hypothetical protein RHMOL_Rhmol13G0100300 [Rhododendron molle]|uniref:Uncharacterized protein n=1 Tax=Rhododendron molle TaxID=49168 RepID=A0ACC0L5L1_RHOML|nr:hypothetical protein RHMOL_Rhmol13G0100300 [Rhododendron molle]